MSSDVTALIEGLHDALLALATHIPGGDATGKRLAHEAEQRLKILTEAIESAGDRFGPST